MRKPIAPDRALLVAVYRYAGGQNIHALFFLASQYEDACQRGLKELAHLCAQKLRTKLTDAYKLRDMFAASAGK